MKETYTEILLSINIIADTREKRLEQAKREHG